MPSKINLESKSPYKLFIRGIPGYCYSRNRIKLQIKYLHSYFYTVYYYIKPQKRTKGNKFEECSRLGRLIVYNDAYTYIYQIQDPEISQIIRISAVKFVELN